MSRRFVLQRRPGPSAPVDFAADLNEQQYAAATAGEGPKLIIAGAGTGKTRTLTYRVAWLLSQGIAPENILLVTFTNKAAREMVDRVRTLTRMNDTRLWGGTFHSMGARFLRRHGAALGYTEAFSILDSGDQRDLLKLCVTDVGIAVERRRFPSAKVLASLISLHANTRVALDDLVYDRYPQFVDWQEEIDAVAARYVARKREANAMDYDDLLVLWLRLLQEDVDLLERYGRRFRHILVDEYQDTNIVQGEIVETLAVANGGNVTVVGDDCQSIYAFRGAHYDNILRFPDRNPETEIFKLETNYRSTPEILALTNASIACNGTQFRKELSAERESGQLPALVPCNYPDQEAAFVVERLLQLRDEGTPLSEIAVLYRAHSHRLAVETSFLRADVPYEVRGGVRFFEQAHVKDVSAHLRLALNPRDEVAFRRALVLQPGIGGVTAERLWTALESATEPERFARALADASVAASLPRNAKKGWATFSEVMQQVLECLEAPAAAIEAVVEGCYRDMASTQFTNFESRLEDLEQLAVFANQYDTLRAFMEEMVLLGEMYGQDVKEGGHEPDEAPVVLSTVHQAKGLEWDAVFFIHLVEGALPSPRAVDEEGGEEEERRVFYVGTTRARRELYLSYPIVRPGMSGALLQQPSRFLQELPKNLWEAWELFEAAETGFGPESSRSGFDSSDDSWDPNVDPVWDDDAYFE